MDTKTENPNPARPFEVVEKDEAARAGSVRKVFVEPEVAFPVDVLESTTFFQFTESGVTNP